MESLNQLQDANFSHPGPLDPDGSSMFPPEVEVIKKGDTPMTPMWAYEPLFKQNKAGKWTVWQIMFEPTSQRIYNVSGQLGGTIRIFSSQVKLNKSGRSLQDQAMVNAGSKYDKKYKDRSRPFGSDDPLPSFFVNLAADYDPDKITKFPVSGQPKLDGIRAYATRDNSQAYGVSMKSRKHNEYPFLDHIRLPLFYILSMLPEGSYVDGEVYRDGYAFRKIQSLIGKKGAVNKHPEHETLRFHVFDTYTPEGLVWEDRVTTVANIYNSLTAGGHDMSTVSIIPQAMLFSFDEIESAHLQYVQAGYEGLMIRHFAGYCQGDPFLMDYPQPDGTTIQIKVCALDPATRTPETIALSQYHQSKFNDRLSNLMKKKYDFEEEFTVVDIVPGKGIKEDLAIIVVDYGDGNYGRVNPMGSHEIHREWLLNKDQYIGLPYTVVYKEKSADGIPREPKGKGFRTYE